MKKYVLVLLILLMSCTTVLKSTKDINNLISINNEISSGSVFTAINSIDLNETELMILTHNINYFHSFVAEWKDIKSLDSKSDIFEEFLQDYYILKSKYIEIENIIIKHWDKYSDDNKVILASYKEKAVKANSTVEYLQSNATKNEMLLQALSFAKIVIGLIK